MAFFVGFVLRAVTEIVVIVVTVEGVEGVSAMVAEINDTLCDEIHISPASSRLEIDLRDIGYQACLKAF